MHRGRPASCYTGRGRWGPGLAPSDKMPETTGEVRPMKVVVRNPRREVELPGNRRVQDVLDALGLNPEAVIVVQGGTLLTHDSYVRDDETIEVISAISGGAAL